ncbi:YdcF family protein [Euhalothece natronophila]|uniref:YdcF family protein n=1 Tax=Euhalothece natronophila TaxID=577489 RepID=UPI001FE3DD0B|nr:YdcF family protein [Euhalothece natronophila]
MTVIISIPVRFVLVKLQNPEPEAILMLGGDLFREDFTAEFGQQHPNLEIWISGTYPEGRRILEEHDLDPDRVHYDDRATDTVTNFTTMIEPLKQNHISHVYLITSDHHMPRSTAIGMIIFGSRGITFTRVPAPSDQSPETTLRIARDVGRSFMWLVTGRTGASFNPRLSSQIKPLLSVIPQHN